MLTYGKCVTGRRPYSDFLTDLIDRGAVPGYMIIEYYVHERKEAQR